MGSTMSIFTEKGAEVRDLGIGLSLRLGLQKSTKRFSFVSLILAIAVPRAAPHAEDKLVKSELHFPSVPFAFRIQLISEQI